MLKNTNSNQTRNSIHQNVSFFRDNLKAYGKNVQELDSYASIRASANEVLKGINCLLDIGNGGVFDYSVDLISNILALDLFLDDIDVSAYPSNITFKKGSALNISEADVSFEGVVMAMLLHHLVGKTANESLNNTLVAIREAMRVLMSGGKLIIAESCVPNWFYAFERAIFPLASQLINRITSHPMTIRYPVGIIANIISPNILDIKILCIPKGKWIMQYGLKFPSILTPVNPYPLVFNKPA